MLCAVLPASAVPSPAYATAATGGRHGIAGAAQDSLPGDVAVRALPGGGHVAVYRLPASAVVAVRLSFTLSATEGPPEGLARIAQMLVGEELEREAAPYGARVSLERSATHASFALSGAAADFPALVAILRRNLVWGGWNARQVATARLVVSARGLRDVETPERLVRRRLSELLFSELPHAADSVPPALAPATLQRFWARSFTPARLQAVVVGPVSAAQALAALEQWPAGSPAVAGTPRDGARADSVRSAPEPRPVGSTGVPQVLFGWTALGWRSEAAPAAIAVAARLLQQRLSVTGLRVARAELWWSGEHRALVALGTPGAAPADATVPGTAVTLSLALGNAAAFLTAEEVRAARSAVAREILFSARTPEGMARYLGEMAEHAGEPAAGPAFLRALDHVDAAAVRALLESVRRPATAEVGR